MSQSSRIDELLPAGFPPLLAEIPDRPSKLYLCGRLPPPEHKYLCVVGARRFTNYGREACEEIISGLRGLPVVVISGLAIGIDAIAHRAALRAGLPCLAIPGSGLHPKVLHPRSHVRLAEEIVAAGGALLSELPPLHPAGLWTFPSRNRLMAGLSHAVLVVEAEKKSGTLITARLAAEYNREVAVIPGPMNSRTSAGPHLLLKLGAAPVRESADIMELLGLEAGRQNSLSLIEECSPGEKKILSALYEPKSKDELARAFGNPAELNALLTILEIKGLIKEELGLISAAVKSQGNLQKS